jgi:hypothetical protein
VKPIRFKIATTFQHPKRSHRHRKIVISSEFRSSIARTAFKKKSAGRKKTATTALLYRELNQRKSTNSGPTLREPPPVAWALTHALGPPHT